MDKWLSTMPSPTSAHYLSYVSWLLIIFSSVRNREVELLLLHAHLARGAYPTVCYTYIALKSHFSPLGVSHARGERQRVNKENNVATL